MKYQRRNRFLFAIAGAALAIAAHAPAGENPRGTIGTIMRTKEIHLNINAAGEPYAFRDLRGNPCGMSLDLQKMLAKEFDADLYITDIDWSGLIPSLLSKKTDVLAVHMSQSIPRAKVIAFTNPFYVLEDVAFIRAKDKEKFGDWNNLNAPGVKIAVIVGTHSEATAKTKFPKAEMVVFNTDVDCFQALVSGRVHAHVSGEGLWAMAKSNYGDEIAIADMPTRGLMADKMAFATRPDDLFTNKFLDFWLAANIENGKIPAIIDYWFHNDAYQDDFKKNAEIGKMSKDRDDLVNLLEIQEYDPYYPGRTRVIEE